MKEEGSKSAPVAAYRAIRSNSTIRSSTFRVSHRAQIYLIMRVAGLVTCSVGISRPV